MPLVVVFSAPTVLFAATATFALVILSVMRIAVLFVMTISVAAPRKATPFVDHDWTLHNHLLRSRLPPI